VYRKHGLIECILTDQGRNFEAHLFKHLCKLVGAEKIRTSSYHAQANGGTERINKVVKPDLAKYVNGEQDNWDVYLEMAVSSINNSYHATLGMTPYEAHYGRPSSMVQDVILNTQLPVGTRYQDVSEFTMDLVKNAENIKRIVDERRSIAQSKMKDYYDLKVKDKGDYDVGDLVKVVNFRQRIGMSKAFEVKSMLPFKVLRRLGTLDYEVGNNDTVPFSVH
jgi:hypothetical protein